ncbi:amidohydrolase family protein [Planococcus sp. ANT_H30]|uniref:amidohydrolase family protein n=1 Tax=Planococcus sp. ANT_H30 TaxID=2597347 RepID=UPI0021D39BF0|nr:amidohydrolase family protein [Planococcus sp. ANT_H30]
MQNNEHGYQASTNSPIVVTRTCGHIVSVNSKVLEAGISVAFSSDAPATAWADPVNPFVGIQAAVTRRAYDGTDTGQHERISIEKAIELYTKGAQEITRIQGVGQLKPGYHADFIVLEEDILEIPELEIGNTRVLETFMAGQSVFRKVSEKTLVV